MSAIPARQGNAISFVPIIAGTLTDNARIGTLFVVCAGRSLVNGANTLQHALGRTPNGYLLYQQNVVGTLSATAGNVAAWTASSITLTWSGGAATVSFFVL